ncbi:hypothetical protein D3C81_304890 [compost metagenome]
MEALRPWILLGILGVLIIRWAFLVVAQNKAYNQLIHIGRLEDRIRFVAADGKLIATTMYLIVYCTLYMVLTLFPLPF